MRLGASMSDINTRSTLGKVDVTRGHRFTVRLAEPEIRLIKRFADENHVLSSVAIRRLLSMGLNFQNRTRSKDVHQTKARTLPIG
jgi:hypothetical protein